MRNELVLKIFLAHHFTRRRDEAGVLVFSACASDLGIIPGGTPFSQAYADAIDRAFVLHNNQTGRNVTFFEANSENYDGEAWVAEPSALDQAKYGLMRVIIFND